MARPTRPPKPPCKHCPEPSVKVVPIPADAKLASVTIPVYENVAEAEAARTWKWVCHGTGGVIRTIEGYAEFGMPHAPIETIEELRDRLDIVLQTLRTRDALPDQPAAERQTPAGPSDGDAPDAPADDVDAGRLPQDGEPDPA